MIRHLLKKFLNRMDASLRRLAVRSRVLSAIYYGLFDHSFAWEQATVLRGWVAHQDGGNLSDRYRLRRYVHSIEKGLMMLPRKRAFALDYINEAVTVYGRVVGATVGNPLCVEEDGQLLWAHDVISSYFDVVQVPAVNSVRSRFLSLPVPNRSMDRNAGPLCCSMGPSPVTYDQFLELCRHRKSVRWFQQQPVPREYLDQAVEAAGLAPSACNRQPYCFRILETPDLVRELARISWGTTGFAESIPVLVAVTGDLSAFGNEWDRHVLYVDASLASMIFVLALESLGLSSCCLNWPEVQPKERSASDLLHLAPHERIVMLIAVGFADPSRLVASSTRKSLQETREYR